MFKKQGTRFTLPLLLVVTTLAIAISSCNSGEPQAIEVARVPQTVEVTQVIPQTVEVTRVVPQTVEVTRVVPQTVIATQIVQVVVTATPEPATPTLEPTPMLAFQKWTSNQVIEAFKAAGLEAEETRPMTKDDYGMAPMFEVEGIRFLIPSLCADCGGRVLSFASQGDLDTTQAYYVELGKSSALFFSWTFAKDNILVQINGDLPEEQARQYEAALNTLKE